MSDAVSTTPPGAPTQPAPTEPKPGRGVHLTERAAKEILRVIAEDRKSVV